MSELVTLHGKRCSICYGILEIHNSFYDFRQKFSIFRVKRDKLINYRLKVYAVHDFAYKGTLRIACSVYKNRFPTLVAKTLYLCPNCGESKEYVETYNKITANK